MPHLQEIVKHQPTRGMCGINRSPHAEAEIGQLMRSSDILAFPSIRELGAGVVVEAMATGLPSIVVDYGGPGGLINPIQRHQSSAG